MYMREFGGCELVLSYLNFGREFGGCELVLSYLNFGTKCMKKRGLYTVNTGMV